MVALRRCSFQVLSVLGLVLLMRDTHVKAAEITCNAPTVRKGESANITCYLNEDVSISKKNTKVQHRPLGSTSFDPDSANNVADCYWINAEDLKCNLKEGYKIIGKVGKTLTLSIASAQTKFAGAYMCEVVPSDPSDIRACDFTVEDDPGYGFVTGHKPEQYKEQFAGLSGGVTAAVVISTLTLVAVVILIVLFLFSERIKQILRNCWSHVANKGDLANADKDQNDADIEMLKPPEQALPSEKETEKDRLLVSETTGGAVVSEALGREATTAEKSGHDPNKIHVEFQTEEGLSEKEMYQRGKVELKCVLAERYAKKKLEEIRKANTEARREQEENDRKNNLNENDLSQNEREKRDKKEQDRVKNEEKAKEHLEHVLSDNKKKREGIEKGEPRKAK